MNDLNPQDDYGSLKNPNQPKSKIEMKSLVPSKHPTEPAAIEPNYYPGYEDNYSDGYYAEINQGAQQHLLRGVYLSLRKHWLLILALNLIVTGATIAYVAQKPDYYKAEARIQVNVETNPADTGQQGGKSVIVNNPSYDPVYFTTQLQIIEGAGLLRRVAKTLDLENNQNFLNPQQNRRLTPFQNVQKMFGLYRPPPPEPMPAESARDAENKLNLAAEKPLDPQTETDKYSPLVGRIKGSLRVNPVRDARMGNRETRLIEIEYTHEDPQIAAKIVNAIGDAYVLQNLEQKIQTNASAGDFLQKRVAELQSEIRRGEERLINYSKTNQILPLDTNQNTVVQRFSDLNLQLGQAENERIAAQTAYQAALQNQMRAATAERSDTQVGGLEGRLAELRQRLAQLKTEYTDEWYEVVETKKQIETIENQLLSLRKRASDIQIATLEERLNGAIARERELRNNFDLQRGEVIRQNEASINYKIIQQEIGTNKTLLDGLLQRWRENDVILNGTPNNVLVADRAAVPNKPIGPERGRNVLLAFIISLFAGGGLAFLIEWLNDSIHHSDEIESTLGLPLLAAIPAAPLSLKDRLIPKSMSLIRQKKHGKKHYNLEAFEKPEYTEAYLQLRTHLMLSTAGGQPQTILITSGEESEGKTLTALNLAQTLAQAGEPILLIDADLRCPRIHLIKELANERGLTTLLTAKEFDEKLIENTIQRNGGGNLHFLTAGERTPNSANLLCSERMRELMENLSARYAHIVIDSPPVLYFADSSIISTLVDAVIIVVRENESSRQTVLKTKKLLTNVGANIVGMVMNGVTPQRSDYNRYKYYRADTDLPAQKDIGFINLH